MKFIQVDQQTQINPIDVVSCRQDPRQPGPRIEWGPHNQQIEVPPPAEFYVHLKTRDGKKYTLRDAAAHAALAAIADLDTSELPRPDSQ
jgi:hypothetical protein